MFPAVRSLGLGGRDLRLKKRLAVSASSMGHPAQSQVVRETTVWTWHVLGPATYVLFSKGQILSKAYHRRRTRSCFIVLAASLPFSLPGFGTLLLPPSSGVLCHEVSEP